MILGVIPEHFLKFCARADVLSCVMEMNASGVALGSMSLEFQWVHK